MLDLSINAVRSRPISGGELISAIEKSKVCCRRDDDFVRIVDLKTHCFPLAVHSLPNLEAFQQAFDVTLTGTSHNSRDSNVFAELSRLTYTYSQEHAWTTWYIRQSREASGDCELDISILAGLRKEGFFAGVQIFRGSPCVADVSRRKEFFDLAIAELGISNNVATQIGDGVLYMRAALPWKLVYPSHQVPGGGNPLGFFACGFAGIDEALSAGERLVKQFAKKFLGVNFVTRLPADAYKVLISDLNKLWRSWEIDVIGSLSLEAINILNGGPVSRMSPARIPAFVWYHQKDRRAYASVVIEDGKRYLEIATDSGTLEQLQERVAFLQNFQFAPLLSDR